MQRLYWMFLGMLVAAAAALLAVILFLRNSEGLSARATPSSIEEWIARKARDSAMPPSAKALRNPVERTPEVLAEGTAHWADHCASCHANDGSGETTMGKGMYPPAPDMRLAATQDLTDGELFYVIENGIRFTGMPGWSVPGHDGTDSWKLVHFIRHLPKLTFEEKREMEQLNPKGPDEVEEERQQEEFLKGEDIDETTHSH